MVTGWQKLGKTWYYMNGSGAMVSGWNKIGGHWYFFNGNGAMLTGWQKIGGIWYYMDGSGAMAAGRWVGNYYLRENGAMAVNCILTIGGVKYSFDAAGIGSKVVESGGYIEIRDSNGKIYKVEASYATDPQVSDEDFLTAIAYAEAGDQGISGMSAVVMVILNRMNSSAFPNDLRTVVYQRKQFEPARTGVLTKYLKNLNSIPNPYLSNTRTAVRNAMSTYKLYKEGKGKRLINGVTLPSGKKEFDYLYFMTPKAFENLGLDEKKCDVLYLSPSSDKYKGHIFFNKWVEK